MRFVSICTLFVVVLTLTIHNVSASPVEPVKQGNQVNQGQNDLSKGVNATCTFVEDLNFTKEEQDMLYKFLTDIVGSNVGCQVTALVTDLYDTPISCDNPDIKKDLSTVLDSLRTVAETPRPNIVSQYKDARISDDEYKKLITFLPNPDDGSPQKMSVGVENAISFPSSFFKEFTPSDKFFAAICE